MSGAADRDRAEAVARRQAFGAGFEDQPGDAATVRALRDGALTLAPHPVWRPGGAIDWAADPFGQRNWRAQLQMLRWLDPLRRRARAGDPAGMDLWERHARDWLDANPPGAAATRWAWSDMVDAVRAEALLFGLPYVRGDAGWLLGALEVHAQWLADPEHLGHSNHALHQHTALLLLGCALGSTAWRTLAVERLRAHVARAYDDEGVNAEGAPGYWALNYRWSCELARRAALEGVDPGFVRRPLERAPESLAHATRPDGRLETIGDTGPAGPPASSAPALVYVSTAGSAGSPPPTTSRVFRQGYAFGRSGWGETERRFDQETFYSLSFGAADRVHGHRDGGSVTYVAGGEPLVVDAGKFAYVSGPARAYVLGREGHNVVHVPGADYDGRAVVELLHHESDDDVDFYLLRDRGYPGVTVERRVAYLRASEALLCADTVRATREVEVVQRWHLPPHAVAEVDRGAVRAAVGRAHLSLLWGGALPRLGTVRGQDQPYDGWFSPRWGEMVPTTVLEARRTGTSFRIVTVLTGVATEQDRLATTRWSDGSAAFVVPGARVTEEVVLGPRGVRVARRTPGGAAVGYRRSASPRAAQVPTLERENAAAVRALARGDRDGARRALEPLVARLAAGCDYGAGAILRDAEHAAADVPPHSPVDPRTREPYPVRAEPAHPLGGERLPVERHDGVPTRFRPPRRRTAHLVTLGGLTLAATLQAGVGDHLVVTFTGALDRERTRLPRFERVRTLGAIGSPLLAVSDATLDLAPALRLAWYLGTARTDLHAHVARVVRAAMRATATSGAVLVGSSGGGFAALQVGSFLPEAHVIAVNAQTDIERYHAGLGRRARDAVFGTGATGIDRRRLAVRERFAGSPGPGRVTCVLNSGDEHHVTVHGEPLLAFLRERRPDVGLDEVRVDWGEGHLGPGVDFLDALVRRAVGIPRPGPPPAAGEVPPG